jgi:pimeloyl-ACP methyl ester carboxylesterase
MKHAPALLSLLLLTTPAAAQTSDSHADTGGFKQPTPAARYRQVATRDNLVHPPGYVTAEPETFGDVVELGTGERTVVLLAGLGPGWRVFDSLIEAKKDELRFLGVTLAGYGGSSAPPMPPAGTSFAEGTWLAGGRTALGKLIEERELERPVIVAFYSDAARIALRYALEEPDRVGGLLVLSASARFPLPQGGDRREGMDAFANNWFKTVTEVMWPSGMWPTSAYANDAALSEKTWWDVLQPTVPTAIRYTVETWADDLVPDLEFLRTPTVVLSPGFNEALMSSQTGTTVLQRFHAGWDAALAAGAPIEHTIVPEARLLLWEDQPEAVHAALTGLVEAVQ